MGTQRSQVAVDAVPDGVAAAVVGDGAMEEVKD